MNKTIVPLQLDGGVTLLIEAENLMGEAPPAGVSDVDRVNLGQKVADKGMAVLDRALAVIRQTTDRAMNQLEGLKNSPEIELHFGVRFTGKGNVVVVAGSGEANFDVVLRWHNAEQKG